MSAALIGSLFSNGVNYVMNKQNNAENRELLHNQNLYNTQMWQMQQEYNTPENQMKRLKEAGINPALAYSNGVDNTASSAPVSSDSHAMRPFQMSDLGTIEKDMAEAYANRKLGDLRGEQQVHEQKKIQLTENTSLNINKDTELKGFQIKEIQSIMSKFESEIKVNEAKINELKQLANLHSINTGLANIEYIVKRATKDDRILRAKLENKELETMVKYYLQQISLGKVDEKLRQQAYNLNEIQYKYLAQTVELEYKLGQLNMQVVEAEHPWDTNEFFTGFRKVTSALGQILGGSFNVHSGLGFGRSKRNPIGFNR